MKKFFALAMFFIMIVAFSPHETVAQVNVSDDICAIDQDLNIDVEFEAITGTNNPLNYAEVGIVPASILEVNETTCMVATNGFSEKQNFNEQGLCNYLESYDYDCVVMYSPHKETSLTRENLTNNFTLNHKLYEANTGYIIV